MHKKELAVKSKEYYLKNKNRIDKYWEEYRKTHKEKLKEIQKNYRQTHKKEAKEYGKRYRDTHKEQKSERDKEYRKNHKMEHNEHNKKYRKIHNIQCKEYQYNYKNSHKKERNEKLKIRRKIDINYRILSYLRSRVSQALKNNIKSKSTITLVGCSLIKLKSYLEKQFKSGMTWENYGTGWNGKGMQEWHIDHIRPCASFDLSKPEEQAKCFHYTNLQPLWAEENLEKSDKFS